MSAPASQIELDALLTADERRVTVDAHEHFLRSISSKSEGRDEIDELVSEIRAAEPNREGKRK